MEQEPSLHPIPQLLSNHMATKYVFVASSLGLFETIASGHQTLQALTKQLDVPSRTLRIIADALVAIGFLEKVEDQYHNTQLTAMFLSGQPGKDLSVPQQGKGENCGARQYDQRAAKDRQ
ncbi:methyltransferase dimerization domain-containing protein [uncultured Tateyamaria sp.]|uniref:methyltransferase family protein n=1 Tax=uncultured Tateyamaria sp. TaxID=455651 RepID=UPI0026398A90|nr:methyltransferase dimerization domain-containing protein [uncultured Tateyamaria sp.]